MNKFINLNLKCPSAPRPKAILLVIKYYTFNAQVEFEAQLASIYLVSANFQLPIMNQLPSTQCILIVFKEIFKKKPSIAVRLYYCAKKFSKKPSIAVRLYYSAKEI